MARGTYIQPYKRGATGLAAEIFTNGSAEISAPGSNARRGLLRITYHGLDYKPQRQFIRVEQVDNPKAHITALLTWSNPSTVNENTRKAISLALNSISRGLGFSADDLISYRTGQGIPNPNTPQ